MDREDLIDHEYYELTNLHSEETTIGQWSATFDSFLVNTPKRYYLDDIERYRIREAAPIGGIPIAELQGKAPEARTPKPIMERFPLECSIGVASGEVEYYEDGRCKASISLENSEGFQEVLFVDNERLIALHAYLGQIIQELPK